MVENVYQSRELRDGCKPISLDSVKARLAYARIRSCGGADSDHETRSRDPIQGFRRKPTRWQAETVRGGISSLIGKLGYYHYTTPARRLILDGFYGAGKSRQMPAWAR